MFDRSEDSDLIQGVLLLPVREIQHLHFFEGVLIAILDSADLVHTTVRTVTYTDIETMSQKYPVWREFGNR